MIGAATYVTACICIKMVNYCYLKITIIKITIIGEYVERRVMLCSDHAL